MCWLGVTCLSFASPYIWIDISGFAWICKEVSLTVDSLTSSSLSARISCLYFIPLNMVLHGCIVKTGVALFFVEIFPDLGTTISDSEFLNLNATSSL